MARATRRPLGPGNGPVDGPERSPFQPRERPMPMIMICDPRPRHDDVGRVADTLLDRGYGVRSFSDGERFLEAAVAQPPDLVVYALGEELESDLGVLKLLRRALPDMHLIVLSAQPSLRTRTAVQPLRPIFYAVDPPDPDEVIEVVQTALERRERPS